jgi:predicted NAD-dependent protein-ADP-ribosyltransferase YbiA (DUF1768 family)
VAGTVHVGGRIFPKGWPENPGIVVLQIDHPSGIEIEDVGYPSVEHAYWALSAGDADVRDWIRATRDIFDVRGLAEGAARVENRPQARTAVMAGLLRAKFRQHPEFVKVLVSA